MAATRASRWVAQLGPAVRPGSSSSWSIRLAQASCSRIGLERSSRARSAASRRIVTESDRSQPIRRPPQKILLAEPTVTIGSVVTQEPKGVGITSDSSDSSTRDSSMTAAVRPSASACATTAALVVRQQRTGRVLEVRDQVGRARGGLPHRRHEPLGVRTAPAVVRPAPARPGRPGRRRCPGRRDSPGCSTSTRSPAPTYIDSASRTACSAPLVIRIWSGVVGRPRAVNRSASRSRSTGTPAVVVARAGQVARQLVQRRGVRRVQLGRRARGGVGQVERHRPAPARAPRPAPRPRRRAAWSRCPTPGGWRRSRTRGAGRTPRRRSSGCGSAPGQLALRREPDPDREPAVQDQQPDPGGQRGVRRLAGRGPARRAAGPAHVARSGGSARRCSAGRRWSWQPHRSHCA